MLPFSYSKAKHRRTESPPVWRDYRTYKPVLRKEFNQKCIYCCRPDYLNVPSFGVDHYKPKKVFPELECEYCNLFYCCAACNSRKGMFWPDDDLLALGCFVPNPCDHIMFDHLRYNSVEVEYRSKAGQWTLDLLDLNDDNTVEYRRSILTLISALEHDESRYEQTIASIEALLVRHPGDVELVALLTKHRTRLAEVRGNLEQLRR